MMALEILPQTARGMDMMDLWRKRRIGVQENWMAVWFLKVMMIMSKSVITRE